MTLEERKAVARTMYTTEQTCGGLAFMAGVVFLMANRFGGPQFAFPLGWAAITLGWALIGYAFTRRALFVRSDNSDPKA